MKKLVSLLLSLALFAAPALAEADNDDARRAVFDAMEVYAWFVISPLDVDLNAPAQEGFYPVLDEVLGSADAMQERLDAYFSQDIQQALWAWDTYRNWDGWLFGRAPEASPLARPIDPDIADVSIALTGETDARREYTATVWLLSLDEPIQLTFVSELMDGRWIFTQFPFFW